MSMFTASSLKVAKSIVEDFEGRPQTVTVPCARAEFLEARRFLKCQLWFCESQGILKLQFDMPQPDVQEFSIHNCDLDRG